jgi:pSer/pThr/pTyr-binding forkhead associated (FHA) protein
MTEPCLSIEINGMRHTIPIVTKEMTIGGATDNTLVLNDPSISPYHARIVEIRQQFYVEDLGSQYGTWVNETLVGEHKLKPWDIIRIGIYTLIFNLEGEPIVT